MSETEELTPFEAKVVTAGHTLRREEDGSVDIFVMDSGYHNGPGCSVCGDSWCHHCDDDVDPCDGGAAQREAEVAARISRASPDMLAALEGAERQLAAAYGPDPDNPGSMGSKDGLEALRSVRAAIAKATGVDQ